MVNSEMKKPNNVLKFLNAHDRYSKKNPITKNIYSNRKIYKLNLIDGIKLI